MWKMLLRIIIPMITMTDKAGKSVTSRPVSVLVNQPYSIEEINLYSTVLQRVKGRVTKDVTFTSDKKWLIDSIVSIEEGATLTIEPGTTVYFRTFSSAAVVSLLSVQRGAKIFADGQSRNTPIVFTSDKTLQGGGQRGDWGGLMIHGNAASNVGTTVLRDGFRYGGSNNTENSGIIRYVRIEYSGKSSFHALSLFGVGSGTTVQYVQGYESYNNAFRVRGGRVSLKYIAGIQHGGYGIWADEGWQGNGQFWLFQTGIAATILPVNYWNQARSIEFRNDDSFFDKAPRTTFRLSNITLIGNGYQSGINNGTRRGIRVRTGSTGTIQNAIITEFPDDAVRVEDLPTTSYGTSMLISNFYSYNNLNNYADDAKDIFLASGNYNLHETAVSGVTKENFTGVTATSFNPASFSTWFTSAPYAGAVDPANDWTAGGSWFKDKNGNYR
ncbi:MAG: hypothetical protein Q4G11_05635 [Gallicola sp.]|nr:hypothetical protein [Gallicola sp.]